MRRLIFTVPSGDETHYWKIKGGKEETVGKVWAPLFHAYSYYLPKAKVPQRLWKRVDDNLTAASIGNLKHALMNMMFLAPMGPNRMIMNLLGSVGFAELESTFAYLDGNVSFGSSHTMDGPHLGVWVSLACTHALEVKHQNKPVGLPFATSIYHERNCRCWSVLLPMAPRRISGHEPQNIYAGLRGWDGLASQN